MDAHHGNIGVRIVAHQIADGTFQPLASTTAERHIEFVFVAVSAPDVTTYSERVSILSQLGAEHGGIVHSLLPVGVFSFGSICSASPGSRLALVEATQARLADAAIVHGSVIAHVGSFGSNKHLEIGFWWPGALDALRHLASLSPGETQELPIGRHA